MNRVDHSQNNRMIINLYLPIITLNVMGLNSPIKRHMELNGYENKTHIYAVYKKPTSEQKIQRA